MVGDLTGAYFTIFRLPIFKNDYSYATKKKGAGGEKQQQRNDSFHVH